MGMLTTGWRVAALTLMSTGLWRPSTHTAPSAARMSLMPSGTATRSSVGEPVLATHALPAATSTLTGRAPTWTARTTCGAGMTCSLPPGGLAGAARIVVVAGGTLVERSACTGPWVKTKAAPALATAAIAAAVARTPRRGARRGPSGHVTEVGPGRGRRGGAVRLARGTVG